MRVVTINTYAGSLLIAARAAGFPVDMSLEDSDFGVPVQKLNFPDLKIFKDPMRWPNEDLSDTCVIAHPPCSAFSNQNNAKEHRGVDAKAFACTIRVLDYSMNHRAKVILVESVTGAYEGAEQMHLNYALRYGYDLYRFFVNSVSFGIPQWRPRFWTAFVRQGASNVWPIYFKPKYVRLRDIAVPDDAFETAGPTDYETSAAVEKQMRQLEKENVPAERVREILSGKAGYGQIPSLVAGPKEKHRYEPGGFQSKHVRVLDPDSWATTLLLDAHWVLPCEQPEEERHVKWRMLYEVELLRIMGFPDDYKIPPKDHKKLKVYLSKGVCPPVAEWVLRQASWWWGEDAPDKDQQEKYDMVPGQVLDLRPKKSEVTFD